MTLKTDINQPNAMMREAGKRPFPHESKTQAIKEEDQYYKVYGSEGNCRFYRMLTAVQEKMNRVTTTLKALTQRKSDTKKSERTTH
ncbi:hypothetical protein [Enterovibrio norvegicus]|uniref:hypothetical protein n=1 Tax=Enterovibrio norvegicus TaxID=188144 RepID=UPI000C81E77C|nr:hypothetical protein [Enterovibrio norvegicus]PML80120.1 hypothetical protein BCT69_03100 [Enterovibrio norvegicus]PMN65276.1 hypothetical protein BCT27_07575 [Enterovibrio norvegicus]